MRNLIGLAIIVIDVLAIIDIIKSLKPTDKKIIWMLIVFFLPGIGALLYYAVGRNSQ